MTPIAKATHQLDGATRNHVQYKLRGANANEKTLPRHNAERKTGRAIRPDNHGTRFSPPSLEKPGDVEDNSQREPTVFDDIDAVYIQSGSRRALYRRVLRHSLGNQRKAIATTGPDPWRSGRAFFASLSLARREHACAPRLFVIFDLFSSSRIIVWYVRHDLASCVGRYSAF